MTGNENVIIFPLKIWYHRKSLVKRDLNTFTLIFSCRSGRLQGKKKVLDSIRKLNDLKTWFLIPCAYIAIKITGFKFSGSCANEKYILQCHFLLNCLWHNECPGFIITVNCFFLLQLFESRITSDFHPPTLNLSIQLHLEIVFFFRQKC